GSDCSVVADPRVERRADVDQCALGNQRRWWIGFHHVDEYLGNRVAVSKAADPLESRSKRARHADAARGGKADALDVSRRANRLMAFFSHAFFNGRGQSLSDVRCDLWLVAAWRADLTIALAPVNFEQRALRSIRLRRTHP